MYGGTESAHRLLYSPPANTHTRPPSLGVDCGCTKHYMLQSGPHTTTTPTQPERKWFTTVGQRMDVVHGSLCFRRISSSGSRSSSTTTISLIGASVENVAQSVVGGAILRITRSVSISQCLPDPPTKPPSLRPQPNAVHVPFWSPLLVACSFGTATVYTICHHGGQQQQQSFLGVGRLNGADVAASFLIEGTGFEPDRHDWGMK